MAYRSWGHTGMMVSEIVQGTALWQGQSELDAFATAFDRGVNYIDMAAYNIANHASLETSLVKAGKLGMGFVAMKVVNLINPEDAPAWRLEKLNAMVDDDSITRHAKAYLWALQNPHVSCCVSDMN